MKDNISFPKSLKFNNISILLKLADSIAFCLLGKRKLQLKNYIKKITEKTFDSIHFFPKMGKCENRSCHQTNEIKQNTD